MCFTKSTPMATQEQPTMINSDPTEKVFHGLSSQNKSSSPLVLVLLTIVVILFGVGIGFLISKSKTSITSKTATVTNSNGQVIIQKGAVYGSNDTKIFPDSTVGVLNNGGIDGEGQYHLVRPGGDGQNVYLTSALVDLSSFINRKIKVNGQTQKAKKAGWLMDVGRVEVLE